MPRFSLDHLTAGELTPPELVEAAAAAGYDAISPWFQVPPFCAESFPMGPGGAMLRETVGRCDASGIAVQHVGLFLLTPAGALPEWEPMLEAGVALGAGRGIALAYDDDAARRLDSFGRLAELARRCGIAIDIEFLAGSGWDSLGGACAFLERAGVGESGIVLDSLHLHRTGGSVRDLDERVRALVRYAQLCDGPTTVAPETALHEAAFERMVPGEGALPLADFIAALPAGVPIGLEVPLAARREAGMPPADRARLVLEAAGALFMRQAI